MIEELSELHEHEGVDVMCKVYVPMNGGAHQTRGWQLCASY